MLAVAGAAIIAAPLAFGQTLTATVAVGTSPRAVAVNAVTNKVYVANYSAGSVTVVDGALNTTLTVPVGTAPMSVAVNPVTNQVYVANYGGNSVTVINGSTNVPTTIAVGSQPYAIAVNPVTNQIFVANFGSNTVTVINGATNATGTIAVGSGPVALAVNPVTNQVYVANSTAATVTVITVTGTTYATSSVIVGNSPSAVAVNPVTNQIYVANQSSNTVSVISGVTNTSTTVAVGSQPAAIGINSVTGLAYVANVGGNTVSVMSGTSVTATIGVGSSPKAIAVNPTTNQVFVANYNSSTVSIIAGATNSASTFSTGNAPTAVTFNPVTDKIYIANVNSGNVSVLDGSTNGGTTYGGFGVNPAAVAVNPVTNQAYVANSGSGTVTVFAGTTNAYPSTVTVGVYPSAIAVNPLTNLTYVANLGSNTVTVINGSTNATTTIAVGASPKAVAVNLVTNQVYVANANSNTVTVINGVTNATTTVAVGTNPVAIAINPATNQIYVVNQGSNTVTVINGATNAATTVAVGTSPSAIAVNPSTNQAWVANTASNNVTLINGSNYSTTFSTVGAFPSAIAINPVTNLVYVANFSSNSVTVISGFTGAITATISVGSAPNTIAINPTSNRIYVGSSSGGVGVTVIDGATGTISLLSKPAAPAVVAVNPVTNQIYVGNSTLNSVSVLAEESLQSIPLSVNITALASNQTSSATPSFTFNAQSSFSPTAPLPQGVLYQVDTWQGPWLRATGNGATFAGVTSALTPGFHTLFAYADDGQDATSTQLDSPIVGGIAAYGFLVTGAPTHFSVSTPSAATVGSAVSVAVTALDAFNNPVTSYSGSVVLTSSDSSATLPATATLSNGTGTFSITLATPGNQTITVTAAGSPTVTGTSSSIAVATSPIVQTATHFSVSSPNSAVVGSTVTLTVTALDSSNNLVAGYTGSFTLTSSDPAASLPTNLTLFGGTGTYAVTFATLGIQTVTAVSSGTLVINGSASVSVVAAQIPVPYITAAPQSQTANAGASAAFWVSVANSSGTTYQWNYNGIPISGATSALLVVSNVRAANAGTYSVTVANSGGSVTSVAATLAVNLTSTGAAPTFTTQPSSVTIANNTTVAFGASATGATLQGTNSVSYQWFANGLAVVGATNPTYLITGATPANAGTYTCLATNVSGSAVSTPATLTVVTTTNPGRLINVSCRGQVGTGANQLITGYIVGGQGTAGTETLLLRASGPALAPFGVTGVLPDPQLQLNNSVGVIASNSGWGGNAQIAATAAAVGAFPWANPASNDAALLGAFFGGNYTAVISGASGDTGIALAEIYDATPAGTYTVTTPRLINISVRDQVGTGGNVLIAGFVIGGSTAKTVLIRASGPALTPFGVTGILPDPQLQLATATSTIATNSGWGGNSQIASVAASVGAFAWPNPASLDSAILVTLPPGAYTALVAGASGDSGIALVEIYEVP